MRGWLCNGGDSESTAWQVDLLEKQLEANGNGTGREQEKVS